MAIQFISSSTYQTSSTTSVNLTVPTGTQSNDIMFCLVSTNVAYPSSVSSGWTSLGQDYISRYYEAFYKVATSSSETNFSCSFSSGGKCKATIVTYRGDFDSSDPIDNYSNLNYNNADNKVTAGSITVTSVNSPIIHIGGIGNFIARTFTKPTQLDNNWVEDYDAGSTDPDFWHNFNSCIWSGSGSTGNVYSTASVSQADKHAYLVALNPTIAIQEVRQRIIITHL